MGLASKPTFFLLYQEACGEWGRTDLKVLLKNCGFSILAYLRVFVELNIYVYICKCSVSCREVLKDLFRSPAQSLGEVMPVWHLLNIQGSPFSGENIRLTPYFLN